MESTILLSIVLGAIFWSFVVMIAIIKVCFSIITKAIAKQQRQIDDMKRELEELKRKQQ